MICNDYFGGFTSIQSVHLFGVVAIKLECEFFNSDIIDTEPCQSSVTVDSILVRLEPPS